jgi:uncharacterized protein with HEPN domain
MSFREDKDFVLDMYQACQRILEYTQGMNFEEFLKDQKTIDAVVRNIEILGEAAKRVSRSLKEKYSFIEWREIARTRDKLIHHYFGVDVAVVWTILSNDVPALKDKLLEVIYAEGWESELTG